MPNRLTEATSPYLLQHKDNPVDWWEWGEEAFSEARRRDVPVLLSVGYAACHWCHVMAHESFEDEATATSMNERYVNVKVDREERPDVDSIYMEAVQAMTGRGGWPMTVWIDHDGRPFFAGTYYPKVPHHGMASFQQVMDAVTDAWTNRRTDVADQAGRMVAAISRELPSGETLDEPALQAAYQQVVAAFDPVNGGFGAAPKFPQQPVLEFLLRLNGEQWANRSREVTTKTLEKMAAGGIHDHLGGGFARYSVDDQWLVPHFEKMLYDNAQLARIYLWAGIEYGRQDFIDVCRKTLDYMATDLRHAAGGFFSSEDADSEGVEGKFYVWTPNQIREVLGPEADEFIRAYGVTDAGNFEGSNILTASGDLSGLEEQRQRLLAARNQRIRPGLDDKVVTSWNGLAIRAFAEAGAALGEERYLQLGSETADFVLGNLRVDGRLMRSWRKGKTSVPGFLDDHAALAVGLFSLFAATGEMSRYHAAIELVTALERFERAQGGFYTTADDAESLVKRPTDFTDNPSPSGSALAAEALLLGSLYTGNLTWRDKALETLARVGSIAVSYPTMVAHHLAVAASPNREVAIVGEGWHDLAKTYWAQFRPGVVLAGSAVPTDEVPLLEGRGGDTTLGYVCQDFICDLPTGDPAELSRLLG